MKAKKMRIKHYAKALLVLVIVAAISITTLPLMTSAANTVAEIKVVPSISSYAERLNNSYLLISKTSSNSTGIRPIITGLTAGTTYVVSFDYYREGTNNSNSWYNPVYAIYDGSGTTTALISDTTINCNTDWATISEEVTPTTTSINIRINKQNTNQNDLMIDNIKVVAKDDVSQTNLFEQGDFTDVDLKTVSGHLNSWKVSGNVTVEKEPGMPENLIAVDNALKIYGCYGKMLNISRIINTTANDSYTLSFDYRAFTSNHVQVRVIGDGTSSRLVNDNLPQSDEWTTKSDTFTAAGTWIQLFVYELSDDNDEMIYFDNIVLTNNTTGTITTLLTDSLDGWSINEGLVTQICTRDAMFGAGLAPVVEGASIRTSVSNQNIRFRTSKPTVALPEGWTATEFGSVMAASSWLGTQDLSLELLAANPTKVISASGVAENGILPDDYYVSLTGSSLSASRCGVRVTNRSYVKYCNSNNETFTVYSVNDINTAGTLDDIEGGTISRSVYGVAKSMAKKLLEDSSASASAVKTSLDCYEDGRFTLGGTTVSNADILQFVIDNMNYFMAN